jgi:hypothetical protein
VTGRRPCPRCGQTWNVARLQVRDFGPVDIIEWCWACARAWPIHPEGTPEFEAAVADLAHWWKFRSA